MGNSRPTPKPARKPKPEVEWISRGEAGRRLGLTAMSITKYCQRGAPTRADKRVPWPAIKEWRERSIVPERSGSWAHRQRAGEKTGHGAGERAGEKTGQRVKAAVTTAGSTAPKVAGSTASKASGSKAPKVDGSPASGSPGGSAPDTAAAMTSAKVNGHAAAPFESLAQATIRDKIAAAKYPGARIRAEERGVGGMGGGRTVGEGDGDQS